MLQHRGARGGYAVFCQALLLTFPLFFFYESRPREISCFTDSRNAPTPEIYNNDQLKHLLYKSGKEEESWRKKQQQSQQSVEEIIDTRAETKQETEGRIIKIWQEGWKQFTGGNNDVSSPLVKELFGFL